MKTKEKKVTLIRNDRTGKVHSVVRELGSKFPNTIYITACGMDTYPKRYHVVEGVPVTCITCNNAIAKKKMLLVPKPETLKNVALPAEVFIVINEDSDVATVSENAESLLDLLRDELGDDEDVLDELEDKRCDYTFYRAVKVAAIPVTETTRKIIDLNMVG